jgi:hypothetical protein
MRDRKSRRIQEHFDSGNDELRTDKEPKNPNRLPKRVTRGRHNNLRPNDIRPLVAAAFVTCEHRPAKTCTVPQETGRPFQSHNRRMLRNENAWSFEHSVDCGVTVEFAWNFWTDVRNWVLDADVESVEIDGPFAAGTRGFTSSKSSGRVEWRIVEAKIGRAVIEFPFSSAVGRFVWTFEDIGGRTRITQHCTVGGEQADILAKVVGPRLEAGIPAGMGKLCGAMEHAARSE